MPLSISSFNNFLKLRVAFGEMFTKDYYTYSLPRPHSKELSPMPYHKNNYPNVSAREAIFRSHIQHQSNNYHPFSWCHHSYMC